MVKTKNKIFSIALCLILCLAMVLGGIKIAGNGKGVSAEGHEYESATIISGEGEGECWFMVASVECRDVSFARSLVITNNDLKIPDNYDYEIDISDPSSQGKVYAYVKNLESGANENPNSYWTDVVIYGDCDKILVKDLAWFIGDGRFEDLETVSFDCLSLEQATSTNGMFIASGLKSIDFGNTHFDTISSTEYMFMEGDGQTMGISSLTEIYVSTEEDSNFMVNALIANGYDETNAEQIVKVKTTPVEETGVDLYSALAISGAMLVIACGCAVVMSKMKRKQNI